GNDVSRKRDALAVNDIVWIVELRLRHGTVRHAEVSAPPIQRRNIRKTGQGNIVLKVFVVAVKKRLVLEDRPAERSADDLIVYRQLAPADAVVEESVGV